MGRMVAEPCEQGSRQQSGAQWGGHAGAGAGGAALHTRPGCSSLPHAARLQLAATRGQAASHPHCCVAPRARQARPPPHSSTLGRPPTWPRRPHRPPRAPQSRCTCRTRTATRSRRPACPPPWRTTGTTWCTRTTATPPSSWRVRGGRPRSSTLARRPRGAAAPALWQEGVVLEGQPPRPPRLPPVRPADHAEKGSKGPQSDSPTSDAYAPSFNNLTSFYTLRWGGGAAQGCAGLGQAWQQLLLPLRHVRGGQQFGIPSPPAFPTSLPQPAQRLPPQVDLAASCSRTDH